MNKSSLLLIKTSSWRDKIQTFAIVSFCEVCIASWRALVTFLFSFENRPYENKAQVYIVEPKWRCNYTHQHSCPHLALFWGPGRSHVWLHPEVFRGLGRLQATSLALRTPSRHAWSTALVMFRWGTVACAGGTPAATAGAELLLPTECRHGSYDSSAM